MKMQMTFDNFQKSSLFFALQSSRVENQYLIYKKISESQDQAKSQQNLEEIKQIDLKSLYPVSLNFKYFYILSKVFADINLVKLKNEDLVRIKKLPLTQKRTSKSKKFVYFDNKYIVKGPYKIGEKQFWNSIYMPIAFMLLQKLTLRLKNSSAIPVTSIMFKDQNNIYLQYQNVGDQNLDDKSIIKNQKSGVDQIFNFIQRGQFVERASERDDFLSVCQLTDCAQHCYLRYVFNIGDSGLHNIILGRQRGQIEEEKEWVYGIDLQESKGDSDYFVKSKKDETRLKKYMKKIKYIQKIDPISRRFLLAIGMDIDKIYERNKKIMEKNEIQLIDI